MIDFTDDMTGKEIVNLIRKLKEKGLRVVRYREKP